MNYSCKSDLAQHGQAVTLILLYAEMGSAVSGHNDEVRSCMEGQTTLS